MSVLAIDQGTTSTRALRLDADGTLHLEKSIEHTQHYPQEGRVEHAPKQLLENIRLCVDAAGPMQAIGIDNQGESCLAWHSDTREPITPVLVWQDKRSLALLDKLRHDGAQDEVQSRAGLPLDPYFSAGKLAWILQQVPAARSALKNGKLRLGTTDAWFLDCLTGRFVTDIATASRTCLMNLRTGQWDDELCRLFGVPLQCLPEIVANTGDFGQMKTAHGLVPITASIVDQQAALYGFGCREPGDTKITFGTGAFALMTTGHQIHQRPDKGLLPTIAWQKVGASPVYALDGGVYTASASLNWARSLGLFTDFESIGHFDGTAAIDSGLAFVPALSGLACPHWDPQARGQWLGLSLEHKATQLVQSILEGVAFRAAEVLNAMSECVTRTGPVLIDGGMSRNPYFVQFLADILAVEVHAAREPELTGLGTALLAADGAGLSLPTAHAFRSCRPRLDRQHARQRFTQAVALSRQWARSTDSRVEDR